MKTFFTIIPSLFFGIAFILAILQVPYPNSLTEASPLQLFYFFIPLFLSLAFTLNLILKNILSSCSISLGFIFLLILKALDSLNLVTAVLIIISIGLLLSYFSKIKKGGLTSSLKIPKLTSLHRRK